MTHRTCGAFISMLSSTFSIGNFMPIWLVHMFKFCAKMSCIRLCYQWNMLLVLSLSLFQSLILTIASAMMYVWFSGDRYSLYLSSKSRFNQMPGLNSKNNKGDNFLLEGFSFQWVIWNIVSIRWGLILVFEIHQNTWTIPNVNRSQYMRELSRREFSFNNSTK